ncbi:MAG: hypothetical protein BGO21_16070 [Dyadobacter sp. 50-39]|nr:MAG: hypothetical protein BGO21_16070 [Dyadobacter sp. 50-39]
MPGLNDFSIVADDYIQNGSHFILLETMVIGNHDLRNQDYSRITFAFFNVNVNRFVLVHPEKEPKTINV